MPCHFSGIFYIKQIENNMLTCSISDENGDIQQMDINYYFPANVDRPFPEAYESIQSDHVYFITGSFAINNKQLIVYLLIVSLIVNLYKDECHIHLSSIFIH